jgi:hypothetical protein
MLNALKMYIQYIEGLCQSRLSTADYALFLVVSATTAVESLEINTGSVIAGISL